jgi:hypothetical protein
MTNQSITPCVAALINYTGRKAQCLGPLIFCAKILRFFRQREIDLRSLTEPLTAMDRGLKPKCPTFCLVCRGGSIGPRDHWSQNIYYIFPQERKKL